MNDQLHVPIDIPPGENHETVLIEGCVGPRADLLKVVTGLCSFLSENTEGSCVATDITLAPGLIFSFPKKPTQFKPPVARTSFVLAPECLFS